jgi:formylglycine-generating enzyme required for sulfatase activity
MWRALRILLAACVLALAGHAAIAAKRVALVIGNGAYTNAPELANPRNDAKDVAAALKALGFEVILGLDLDKRAMDRKILEFADALSGAEAGVFHYSGHGLQVAGVNYLVPVDASLGTAASLDFEAVRLDLVQRTMERETKTNILFLDACRNNPLSRNLARALGTRSAGIGHGLAPMESGAGTLISFSTQPGNVALDGQGRNSPYTGPLVKALGASRDDVLSMLTAVRNEVMAATGDKQVPWDNNALRAKFYFSPGARPATQPSAGTRMHTAVVASKPARAPAAPAEPACDGLLVSVAMGAKPCIKAGSGQSFKDCPGCPEMVAVPSGSFLMGSPKSEPGHSSNEWPQRSVTFAKPFAIGRFAVTFAEWDACEADGGCRYIDDEDKGRGDRPVSGMNWDQAKAYAAWLSKKTGMHYRLLSGAEFEYAARAGTVTPFWWGSSITTEQANYDGSAEPYNGGQKGENRRKTLPVKSFNPNPWGLYQIHGNVSSWTEDCYHHSLAGVPSDGSAWTADDAIGNTVDCEFREWRGGSWSNSPGELRAAYSNTQYPGVGSSEVGLRVARTLQP